MPDIKTIYSLMNFGGKDPSGYEGTDTSALTPFIDNAYFTMSYGDQSVERIIDAQWATTSIYVDKVMSGQSAMFGLNLADGRIKGYPTSGKSFYVYCVRGNENYGKNSFVDNGDKTITDNATGLMWEKDDSGSPLERGAALTRCESATSAGYSDWRLPNVKELHSITDYTRSPGTTNSAVMDPIFSATSFTNEAGVNDYGWYWSGTTHVTYTGNGSVGAYVTFGCALGYMSGKWLDVHGCGGAEK